MSLPASTPLPHPPLNLTGCRRRLNQETRKRAEQACEWPAVRQWQCHIHHDGAAGELTDERRGEEQDEGVEDRGQRLAQGNYDLSHRRDLAEKPARPVRPATPPDVRSGSARELRGAN
jgi:hypothetical protein